MLQVEEKNLIDYIFLLFGNKLTCLLLKRKRTALYYSSDILTYIIFTWRVL